MDLMGDGQKRLSTNIPYVRSQDVLGDTRKSKSCFSSIFKVKTNFIALLFSIVIVAGFITMITYVTLQKNDYLKHSYTEPMTIDETKSEVNVLHPNEISDDMLREFIFIQNLLEDQKSEKLILPNSKTFRVKRQIEPDVSKCQNQKKECDVVFKNLQNLAKSVQQKMNGMNEHVIEQGILQNMNSEDPLLFKIMECIQCRNAIAHRAEEEEYNENKNVDYYSNEIDLAPYILKNQNDEIVEDQIGERRRDVNGQMMNEQGQRITATGNKRVLESVTNNTRKLNDTKITVILHNTTIIERDGPVETTAQEKKQKINDDYRSRIGNITANHGGPSSSSSSSSSSQVTTTLDDPNTRPIILPTAETSKTSQQVQFAPQTSWPSVPVCFYGPPSSAASASASSSSNSYHQFNTGPSLPFFPSYPQMQGTSNGMPTNQQAMHINSPQFKQNLPPDFTISKTENFPPSATYLLPSSQGQSTFILPTQAPANHQGSTFIMPQNPQQQQQNYPSHQNIQQNYPSQSLPYSSQQPMQFTHRENYNLPIYCAFMPPNNQQNPQQQQQQQQQQHPQQQQQQRQTLISVNGQIVDEEEKKKKKNKKKYPTAPWVPIELGYNSDEDYFEDCDGFWCSPPYRKCVLFSQRCDGIVDCANADDETDCPPQPDDYQIPYSVMYTDQRESSNNNNNNNDDTRTPTVYTMNKTKHNHGSTMKIPEITVSEITTQESETTTEKFVETTVLPNVPIPSVPPYFLCKKMIQSIALDKRCDHVFDCEDASDEEDCKCKDYLKGNQISKICDGHVDCYDGSDEENCDFCNDSEYYCHRSGNCISNKKRCDDVKDCKYNEDEMDCFALTDGENVNLDMDNRPYLNLEGVLTKYEGEAWRTTCVKSEFRNDSRRMLVGQKICDKLGFKNVISLDEVVVHTTKLNERPATKDSGLNNAYTSHYTPLKPDENTCYGIYVRCKPILNQKLNEHFRVDKKTQERNYMWPWEAAIFVDGKYRCSALLLDNNLLLSTSKCGEDVNPRTNYTAALMGASSIDFPFNSPYQQVSTVTNVKPLKNSDASIFQLKDNVNMTRYVQPIYLEKSIFPASEEDTCIAIGVNQNHTRKIQFLKTVVDNCPKCHRCYIEKDESSCPRTNETSNWSGNVVCQSKGGWYPAAVFQDKDESCGFGTKQILNSIDYIHAHLSEAIVEGVEAYTEPHCDGMRCPLGQCIPWNRVCDGVRDCPAGLDEDEAHCSHVKDRCEKDELDCRCSKSELRCGDGKCISKDKFCDGKIDCNDGSDETDRCNCADYLRLTDPKRVCDGVRNCYDKSDESYQHCLCKDSSFKCSKSPFNGTVACISEDFVCDGHPDCPQGEDEVEDLCWTIKSEPKDGKGKGEVMRRTYGVLQSECFPRPIQSQREVTNTCNRLGYTSGMVLKPAVLSHTQYTPRHDFYMVQVNNYTWITMRQDASFGLWKEPDITCYRVFVHCF